MCKPIAKERGGKASHQRGRWSPAELRSVGGGRHEFAYIAEPFF